MNQTERDYELIDAEDIVNAYLNDFEDNVGKYFAYITNGNRLSILLRDTSEGIQDFLSQNQDYKRVSKTSQVREPLEMDFLETHEEARDREESFKRFQRQMSQLKRI